MRGEHIPNAATLQVRITRPHWIGFYITLLHAGLESPKQRVACLWPGSLHPRHCPPKREPPTTSTTGPATTPPIDTATQPPPPPPPNREALTSFNGTAGDLAPYSGEFTAAFQPFISQTDTITYLGLTVGNPNVPVGHSGDTLTLRLCETATCEGVPIASSSAVVDNYGLTAADIGDVAVIPGHVYYLVWSPPVDPHGSHWVTFWHRGAPTVVGSEAMEAVVRGFNKATGGPRRAILEYGGSQPPPVPYSGSFVYAYQKFKAASNRITTLGVVVGNPKLGRGELEAPIVVRLCDKPECSDGALATATPNIVNYGITHVDIGDVPVTPGATYFINWLSPKKYEGASWVTFWFGSPQIEESDLTEALVKGYDQGPAPEEATYSLEQTGNLGAPTFSEPFNATGEGPKIPANEHVEVSCKQFAPDLESSEPDGYWYRIHTAPWNDTYYAVANTFWNGAPPGGETINTDLAVPNC